MKLDIHDVIALSRIIDEASEKLDAALALFKQKIHKSEVCKIDCSTPEEVQGDMQISIIRLRRTIVKIHNSI